MFLWYKESTKCYAYLSDVDASGRRFQESRWFTRAWTLQELLAPSHVKLSRDEDELPQGGMEFFSSDWNYLGTKKGLRFKIAAATGIAEEYLIGQRLDMASISMRMSWASGRRATRTEDIAYSLLGIFDVNMPLLYGEGKVKAFRRLQEEIMKVSEDETLFAWESMELTTNAESGNALASDPKDFMEARDLIPFASDDPIVPYALTHRGLRIWLQIYHYGEEIRPIRPPVMVGSPFKVQAAVLRCHIAHDFNHVVVIPLHHLTANLYIRDSTTNVGLLPTRLLRQSNPTNEVYIRNTTIHSISNSVRRRYGFLIRNLPHGFTIPKVLPEDAWNPKDRILQKEADSRGLRLWHATLELCSRQFPGPIEIEPRAFPQLYSQRPRKLRPRPLDVFFRKTSIYLSLGCRQEQGEDEVKSWCHLDDVIWSQGVTGARPFTNSTDEIAHEMFPQSAGSLETFHRSASSKPARHWVDIRSVWDKTEYHVKLRTTITPERVFGQRMFVVDVEFVGENNLADLQRRAGVNTPH
jgi:hypothetical protein